MTSFQLKKLSGSLIVFSHLVLGSLVLKTFESGRIAPLDRDRVAVVILGVVFGLLLWIAGIIVAGRVEEP